MHKQIMRLVVIASIAVTCTAQRHITSRTFGPKLVPHRISLANGKSFELNLPADFVIKVAAQGLRRVRFMAKSPDARIFVTDMYNLTDNEKGAVYIVEDFDENSGAFRKLTTYLAGLRNPNSVAFYTDSSGTDWLYLALTGSLIRYKYNAGDNKPASKPEVIATFPDYGLDYKYGGWHLTRTISVAGNGKIYVSVGSSCNACEEKEDVRASILEMDPDGSHQRRFATGLRNAVGIRWIKDRLLATNMGADHLGDDRPADTMYVVQEGQNYGWPYCYQSGPGRFPDPKFNPGGKKMNCRKVPRAFVAFNSHSSPLGFDFFDSLDMGPVNKAGRGNPLRDSFLVALHGSTKEALGHGYRVVKLQERSGKVQMQDFITGFLTGNKINGRPADILQFGPDGFLLTDDRAGVIYFIQYQGQ
jgi:glucose/arabinose dehydrogenase